MKKLLIVLPLALLLAAGCSKTTSTSIPQVSTPVTENASPATGSTTQTGTSTSTSSPATGEISYSMAQVTAANSAAKCWTTIRADVYDLTAWIEQHPGGSDKILSICGKDGTSAFEGEHGSQRRPENELTGYKIGSLAK